MLSIEKIKGNAFQDDKTKRLVERLPRKSIAVVVHQDIDPVAAEKLIQCGVKAVINFRTSMSGLFFHNGVEALLNSNIPVFDIEEELSVKLDGKLIMIKENTLFLSEAGAWKELCKVVRYSNTQVRQLKLLAKSRFPEQFKSFVGNSLYYSEKELNLFVSEVQSLPVLRQFLDKEVLIVARGANYERDLVQLKQIIKRKRLITIAVDGGADGLLKIGVKPDFIIGDMDSVSQKALKSGAQLLVHTYRDGRSPGEVRINSLGLPYKRIKFLGTSEDVATIFAYCSGAKKLYTIGTRLGMNEFLEKGRIGMGSTLLTRMKVGHVLVDLKGIHSLFHEEREIKTWTLLPAAVAVLFIGFSQRFELFVSLFFQWWAGRS
ncbi:hypothetical protein DS745_15045 [Anaerobacillus alkaliphilus]|uniref:Thiamin pyrophosphokinase catalytic domain-containing protein n=1 Tax=Anaerobacillus alkaliphilus TaxID=1548597 RepID=A0A4Q0VSF9_9BACI|nr:putative cytokinetic ring protein SteA [Anaerobacillus alkaliphilus]RXI99529.1 hypothetical protein DS745_15045 [Anaerobacillus alkaliphilus]